MHHRSPLDTYHHHMNIHMNGRAPCTVKSPANCHEGSHGDEVGGGAMGVSVQDRSVGGVMVGSLEASVGCHGGGTGTDMPCHTHVTKNCFQAQVDIQDGLFEEHSPGHPHAVHRYAFAMEYDGTPFSGWQYQQGALTIQQVVQQALFKLVSEHVVIYASGRTDRGVHALGQVFHADFHNSYSLDRLRRGLNACLAPWPLSIWQVAAVPLSFHARFSAQQRTYVYDIVNRSSPSPLWAHRAWWVPQPLDEGILQQAAVMLVGHHDFSAFRHRDCQSASPWKSVDSIHLESSGPWLRIRVSARSFLHRQVRMMIGAIVWAALGRLSLSTLEEWLLRPQECNRKAPSAPAHGLYFAHVDFACNPFALVPVRKPLGGVAVPHVLDHEKVLHPIS